MPFSPSDITGIQLWLKADSIAGNDGDAIGTWSDSTGIGRDHAQSVAGSKPLLKKSANGINGVNVVRFDGIDDALFYDGGGSGTSIIRNRAVSTIAVVFRATNTTQDGTCPYFLCKGDTLSGSRAAFFFGLSADGKLNVAGRRLDADSFQSLAGSNKSTSPTFALAYFDWANSNLTLYENGSQTAQTLSFQTDGNTEDTNSLQIVAGAAAGDGSSAQFNGDIAEVIIYDSIISTANRNLLGGYIQTKYAITIAGADLGGAVGGGSIRFVNTVVP